MKHVLFLLVTLSLISCGGSGGSGGGAITNVDGMTTEDVGSGVTRAYKKDGAGNLVEQGFLTNGVKNGVWMNYYDGDEAGKIKKLCSYSNGVLNGPCYEFNNRGQIETEYNYLENEYDGIAASYKFGRPNIKQSYANGMKDGPEYKYFESGSSAGKLQQETNFKEGKQHGKMVWYKEDGSITMQYEYKNGEKVSGGMVDK